MLRMRTVLTTVATITTVTTVTTVATIRTTLTTVATLTTLRALTALTTGRTLNVVGRLLDQHTVRELVLTSLRIDLKQLHLDLVALLDTSILNRLEALPVDLRDMEQAILARHDLYEAAIRHD